MGGLAVRAVFFDSGHTLMRPVGGRWFPGVRFFDLCRSFDHAVPDDDRLARACAVGYAYLDAHHDEVSDEEAERRQFVEYHRLIFASLGRAVPAALIHELAESAVSDLNFEPYPGTRTVLDQLAARGTSMAVVTDGWPSTRSKFATLGYLDYFAAIVISSEQKCTKPDMGMFRPALDALSVTPREVLFVDDAADLVDAARRHGFRTLLMDHGDQHVGHPHRITKLEQLLEYLG